MLYTLYRLLWWNGGNIIIDVKYPYTIISLLDTSSKSIWSRSSEKNNLRYTVMLSDGDGKAHTSVNRHPYAISKEECINHVHKRLTCHLSKVATAAKRNNM